MFYSFANTSKYSRSLEFFMIMSVVDFTLKQVFIAIMKRIYRPTRLWCRPSHFWNEDFNQGATDPCLSSFCVCPEYRGIGHMLLKKMYTQLKRYCLWSENWEIHVVLLFRVWKSRMLWCCYKLKEILNLKFSSGLCSFFESTSDLCHILHRFWRSISGGPSC